MMFLPVRTILIVLALVGLTRPAVAQDEAAAPADDAQDMAKALSNPVASMISVPFQYNVDFDVGQFDGVKSTLNIQPVIPIKLSDDWNLIVRTILPIVHQEDVIAPTSSQFGLGDTSQSLFFSPAEPTSGGIIWAVGPILYYPTATSNSLGAEKWGAGPTGLVLKQAGKNTFGLLANHIWSIGGADDRADISSSFIQPFFSHTNSKALTLGINSETTYDWKNNQWVIPINLTATQLTKVGKQPISIGGGFRYYVEKPVGGPDWGIRLITTLLFR